MKNSILLRSILFVAVIFLIKISQPASSVFAGYYTWTNIGLKGEYIDSIAIDPKTPSIIYAGALSGVFKSINGGETWTTINNGLNIPWSNDNNHLAIDPTNTDIIYTAIDDGVFKSTNGGGNWTAVNNGLFLCQMLSLAIDPITPATIYVGTCGGVYKSINGGGNWVPINNGLSSTTIAKDLTIDPKTPSTLYVSSWPGVKKSINGGQNWDTVYSTSNIYSLAIDPLTTTTIYAFGNSGLIKSTNGGGNWSAANTGLTDKGPIVIDPKTPSTVYVGTYYFSGVFKSTNGGGNWNPVDNSGLRDDQGYSLSVNSIAIDPITPSTIYAGTRDGVFVMQQIEEPRYSISGKATISGTTDFSAVTISVGNGITTSTDTNGNYTLSNLKSGNYTITPSKAGYTFSPLSIPVTIASANIIGQNFTAVPTKVWTLIYYLAGDNDLSSSYGKIFNQLELGNNSATQVLVLLDQRTIIPGDSAYYLIQHDTNLSSFASYTEGTNKWSQGELDMNDPQTLINFGQWVYRNFPSQHYALFLDDHGSGLTGAMAEETLFTKKIMSVNQIKDALNTITNNGTHKFDIITMNACLMGMIEDAYNFRGTMDYYVASENLQWSYLNGYTNQVNSATPGKTPMQYAKDIVSSYITDSGVSSAPYTFSVADMSKIDGLYTAINNLADVLNTTMAENISAFSQVIYNVQRFNNIDPLHTGIDTNDTYADLYDFAYQVESLYQTPSVTAAAQTLINAIQTYVNYSAQNNNSDVKNSHGVSIFMPNTLSSFYTVDNYDFAWGTKWPIPGSALSVITNGSGWGNMLVTYLSITQPNGIDDPNPPEAFSKPQYYKYLFLPIVNN